MTIHDKIKSAVSRYKGKTLTGAEIKDLVIAMYPGTNRTSILPNDHADGNLNPCRCANTPYRIFDRLGDSLYKVL